LKSRKFFFRYDLIIVVVVLIIAVAIAGLFHLQNSDSPYARAHIIYQGQLIKSVNLEDEYQTFSVLQLPQVEFSLSKDGVAFVNSDCPDQVCVNTGKISQAGQFAACLPNEVLLIIYSEEPGQIDIITR
jgi:hypothetical protein